VSGYTLNLRSAMRSQRIDHVASFVGTDASGSFGILPGRARFMTILEYGLSRFRLHNADWQYIACPGALLVFADEQLTIATRRYVLDDDYVRICAAPTGQLAREEAELQTVTDSLRRLERELLRRLRELDPREYA
jgi:F-type H+-transporting ATPase subunit epsilon